jgi:hypothetical protein
MTEKIKIVFPLPWNGIGTEVEQKKYKKERKRKKEQRRGAKKRK